MQINETRNILSDVIENQNGNFYLKDIIGFFKTENLVKNYRDCNDIPFQRNLPNFRNVGLTLDNGWQITIDLTYKNLQCLTSEDFLQIKGIGEDKYLELVLNICGVADLRTSVCDFKQPLNIRTSVFVNLISGKNIKYVADSIKVSPERIRGMVASYRAMLEMLHKENGTYIHEFHKDRKSISELRKNKNYWILGVKLIPKHFLKKKILYKNLPQERKEEIEKTISELSFFEILDTL